MLNFGISCNSCLPTRTNTRIEAIFSVAAAAWILSIVLAGGISGTARAACLKDSREIAFTKGSARIRSYLCDVSDGAPDSLRVEFHRLGEAATGQLVMGTQDPDAQRFLGSPRIVRNAVYDTAAGLYREFGTETKDLCPELVVEVPKGGRAFDSTKSGNTAERAQCNSARWSLSLGIITLTLPRDSKFIHTKLRWPDNYRFFYTKCEKFDPLDCTIIWRYMKMKDIIDFESEMKSYESSAGTEGLPPQPGSEGTGSEEFSAHIVKVSKYRRFIEHLSQLGLPEDFAVVVGTLSGCGEINFSLYPHQLITDIVTIENVSDETLTLDRLLGELDRKEQLRLPRPASGISTSSLPGEAIVLQPGGKVLIPLRLTLVPSDDLRDTFKNVAIAEQLFQRIQSSAPGTVFAESHADESGARIRKIRESFGPPQVPPMGNYLLGPDISLKGVVVGGQDIIIDETSANYLELTSASEEGSCPILYIQDVNARNWIRHGKVIHKANAKEKEATVEVPLRSYATRFRIAEEEPELSHIDRVNLRLELQDGTFVILEPSLRELGEADGIRLQIPAGKHIEFEFHPPTGVTPRDVKQAVLFITGYYQRYSTMHLSER